ncbi:SDR family NAD(P)-dependent oxidoreductase [Variovorax sp. VNK109]|uniref:SDR family NAD(P)-dependent oxidoreductase n=1 Tax=Variovorax sp. VNK109 TaxID=3400919 RepID=UPI003C01ED10
MIQTGDKRTLRQRVLVTGGTSGVGFAIARLALAGGAQVVVSGRDPKRGAIAESTLRLIAPDASFVCGDAADWDGAFDSVEQAVRLMGGLDVLISAGAEGAVPPTPFMNMSPAELQAAFGSRVFGRVFPIRAAVPHMQAARSGSIVLLTTDAGRHATPGESIVGATGASLIMLTKALARELSPFSIRVNALALTLTSDTPSWDRIFSRPGFEQRLFAKALERFPSGRAPTADEVARVAIFMASESASQVTGQTLSVNGGLSFGGW